jgi:glycosyltransferase involved in cell wall biosynthesis
MPRRPFGTTKLGIDKRSDSLRHFGPTFSNDLVLQPRARAPMSIERTSPVKTRASCDKIVLLITEDWFALSHFRPLISLLCELAREVVVVTRSSGRLAEIEALGARTLEFDFRRGSNNQAVALQLAWRLARLLKRERPDVVHLIAIKPIVLGGVALRLVRVPHVVVHITGQGLAGIATDPLLRLYRFAMLRVLASQVRKPTSLLLVENPDDLAMVRNVAPNLGARFAILGGAGVDPAAFPALPAPEDDVPVAAHVGRMIRSKGIDLLMQAYDRLRRDGVSLGLELFGSSDRDNPEAIPPQEIESWCRGSGANWHGPVADVAGVWKRADIFVLASRGGEGLPRALLEAASCARPLVVSDVPGNRHFVRDGIEGLLVPPGDVSALATALRRLANDRELRLRLGLAARRRLLEAFTEEHVRVSMRRSYTAMLGAARPARTIKRT